MVDDEPVVLLIALALLAMAHHTGTVEHLGSPFAIPRLRRQVGRRGFRQGRGNIPLRGSIFDFGNLLQGALLTLLENLDLGVVLVALALDSVTNPFALEH